MYLCETQSQVAMCTSANFGGIDRASQPFRRHLPRSFSPSSALIRRNWVNSHEVYVSPRRWISMQIHRDGRFAVKFQGLPRRNPTLYLRSPFLLRSLHPSLRWATSFLKLYELSVHSSQLLCWELTRQHPISNKACRRTWEFVSLQLAYTFRWCGLSTLESPYPFVETYFQFSPQYVFSRTGFLSSPNRFSRILHFLFWLFVWIKCFFFLFYVGCFSIFF